MDVEKTIEFIVGQQAQFSADLERLAEENRAIAGAVHVLLQVSQQNTDAIKENGAAIKELRLGMEQDRVARREDMENLTSNMNALIKVVDGLVRRSNGDNK